MHSNVCIMQNAHHSTTITQITFVVGLGGRQSICFFIIHYNDVIMGAIASQITCLAIVYSIVYSVADQRKHQSSASLAFVRGSHRSATGEFPAQRASNAENVSIWWRHHVAGSSSYSHKMFLPYYSELFYPSILSIAQCHCTLRLLV